MKELFSKHGTCIAVAAFYIAAAVLLCFILKWLGFDPWQKTNVIEAVKAISWPHTTLIGLIVLALIFRGPVSGLINRLIRFTYGKDGFSAEAHVEEVAKQAQRSTNTNLGGDDAFITEDDLVEEFKNVPYIQVDSIERNKKDAFFYTVQNGLTTKLQLRRFVRTGHVFEHLAALYRSELGRTGENVLDAVAVSTWGVLLYLYGGHDEIYPAVKRRIHESPEAKAYRSRQR